MVDFGYMPSSQTNLVAIGAVSCRCGGYNFSLGQLAFHGLIHRQQRIRRAGHAHGLINIAAAGQRVADGSAQAGSRAAERLDFGRVVVGLVFKHQKPILLFSVYVHFDFNRAGIDLFRLVQIVHFSGGFEHLGADGGKIHQRYRLVAAAGIQLFAQLQIIFVGLFDILRLDIRVFNNGAESGVPAMVGPVGVDHADFGDSGAAFFLVLKILLAEFDVI